MKKNLNHYLGLPYKIEIIPIPEEEGGGYMARLPQFGVQGIVGDGETREEALADLEENQKDRFEWYMKEGYPIPEPEKDAHDYSGRFIVRMPKFLHRNLALGAQKNNISLNQYVCTLLSMNAQFDQLSVAVTKMREEVQTLRQCVGDTDYQLDNSDQT